jgi:hypothetical protein
MDVINENFADPSAVIAWTFETIRELANVLKNGRGHLFVSPDVPEFPRQGAASAALVPENATKRHWRRFQTFSRRARKGSMPQTRR